MIKFIPGVHPTYKEQFDKLTRAYISDNVYPWNPCACFIGNLLNNKREWIDGRVGDFDNEVGFAFMNNSAAMLCIRQESSGLYSGIEIVKMEELFLKHIVKQRNNTSLDEETILFEAFSMALDALRAVHEAKGEIIESIPQFQKRQPFLVATK